jgi:hypothetical protein
MFEEAAHMTTAEALAGREEVVERLSGLVRRFGMERTTDEAWWRPDAEEAVSLDSFCDYPGSRGEATAKDPRS